MKWMNINLSNGPFIFVVIPIYVLSTIVLMTGWHIEIFSIICGILTIPLMMDCYESGVGWFFDGRQLEDDEESWIFGLIGAAMPLAVYVVALLYGSAQSATIN